MESVALSTYVCQFVLKKTAGGCRVQCHRTEAPAGAHEHEAVIQSRV